LTPRGGAGAAHALSMSARKDQRWRRSRARGPEDVKLRPSACHLAARLSQPSSACGCDRRWARAIVPNGLGRAVEGAVEPTGRRGRLPLLVRAIRVGVIEGASRGASAESEAEPLTLGTAEGVSLRVVDPSV